MRVDIRWAAALLLCALLVTACVPGAGDTHAVKGDTEYYLDGPQQARPPDGTLVGGTRVRVMSVSGSYALVLLPDGRTAYVASDSLEELR